MNNSFRSRTMNIINFSSCISVFFLFCKGVIFIISRQITGTFIILKKWNKKALNGIKKLMNDILLGLNFILFIFVNLLEWSNYVFLWRWGKIVIFAFSKWVEILDKLVFHLNKISDQFIDSIFLISYFQKEIKLRELFLLVHWRTHLFLAVIQFVLLRRRPFFVLSCQVVLSTLLIVIGSLVVEILLGSWFYVWRRAFEAWEINRVRNLFTIYFDCIWTVLRRYRITLGTNCLNSNRMNRLLHKEQISKDLFIAKVI